MKELIKNKKVMMAFAVLVMVIAFVIIRKRRKDAEDSDIVVTETSDSISIEKLPSASFPLRPKSSGFSTSTGSYGKQIAELQKMCNEKYGTNLVVDGKFGPNTEKAFEEKFPTLLFPGEISQNHYNTLMA